MQKDEIINEINKINTEFYNAFENFSTETMDKIWKHNDDVVCIHPGWDLFTGWLAVKESWITIFNNTERIKFIISNTKVRIFDNNIAVVVCLENIETTAENGQVIKIGINATNIFEQNDLNKWLLIHHHGSPVANYIPPNVSSQ
ncbi:MAG: nuclear transport factor 2 family protein [Candidatus Nitrosocosmicus sp.]|jgi:ketosteroid isomerase-like protein